MGASQDATDVFGITGEEYTEIYEYMVGNLSGRNGLIAKNRLGIFLRSLEEIVVNGVCLVRWKTSASHGCTWVVSEVDGYQKTDGKSTSEYTAF